MKTNKGKDFRHTSNARWKDRPDHNKHRCTCTRCQDGRRFSYLKKLESKE